MFSTKSRKLIPAAAALLVAGMMVTEPAQAATLFDRIASFTSSMPIVRNFLIYIFFVIGVGAIGWAGMEMLKKSKDRGGDDVSWSGIGLKFIAGALLVGVTVTTDTMRETVLGGSGTTSTINVN